MSDGGARPDSAESGEVELADGYRQWYASRPCCMQDAVPDIKRRLDEEAAAQRRSRAANASALPTPRYVVRAIDPVVCAELRVCDDAGNPPEAFVDSAGGSPLRCCLTVSEPGEPILLAAYAPLRRWAAATGADPGAYLEVGPVFLHPGPCAGPAGSGYPHAYRDWPRVLRAYDTNGRIRGGVVVDGTTAPEAVIEELFADTGVAFLHARAPVAGCFTFWIDRVAT
jgi:hypothetical protein